MPTGKFFVQQSDFRQAKLSESESLRTEGLGPCIAIAICYRGNAFLLHSPNARVEADTLTTPFFECVCKHIPVTARSSIRPVVLGGRLDFEDPEDDELVNADTELAREYVLNNLSELGFGAPQKRWCPTGHYQNVLIRIRTNIAEIETAPMVIEDVSPTIEKLKMSD